MKHHVLGCLEDESPDTILLHYGTKDLRSVALSTKNRKNTVYLSELTVRNDKYDRKGKEVNVILKKKCNDKNLSFIDNGNINPHMLNKSGLCLNEYGTTQLVNNFCYRMKKWRDKICLDNESRRKKLGRFKKGKKYLFKLFSG